jgi:predicted metal-binding protein
MKIGFIRCMKSSDMIPAMDDLMSLLEINGIKGIPAAEISLSGLETCGGCPGLKALTHAENLVEGGAEALVFISPLLKNKSGSYNCPHLMRMVEASRMKFGDDIPVLDYQRE